MKTQQSINVPLLYEIRVAGHLSDNWAARFEGLSMRHDPDGETVLSGMLDQAALHGVLAKIRDLARISYLSTAPVNWNHHNKAVILSWIGF